MDHNSILVQLLSQELKYWGRDYKLRVIRSDPDYMLAQIFCRPDCNLDYYYGSVSYDDETGALEYRTICNDQWRPGVLLAQPDSLYKLINLMINDQVVNCDDGY